MSVNISIVMCPEEFCRAKDWKRKPGGEPNEFVCRACEKKKRHVEVRVWELACPGCGKYVGVLSKRPRDLPFTPKGRDAHWCTPCANDPLKHPAPAPKLLVNREAIEAALEDIRRKAALVEASMKALDGKETLL